MFISIFDLLSIGIGPSSSHTVGPMRAAYAYLNELKKNDFWNQTACIKIELYGSLALTGEGHKTDEAVIMGLLGHLPETIDPSIIPSTLKKIRTEKKLSLFNEKRIVFNEKEHLIFHKDQVMPYHSNALRFIAFSPDNQELFNEIFYSIGGGFIVEHRKIQHKTPMKKYFNIPHPFATCSELLAHCDKKNISIHQIMYENELSHHNKSEIKKGIKDIWEAMQVSVINGCKNEGFLPGRLKVKRRAPDLLKHLQNQERIQEPEDVFDWVSLYALAVNEENAAGGRVVTAPTNGGAGVVPAVMHYFEKFTKERPENWVEIFLMTASAIGILYKKGASISAAEMGCQGEVGVACSMAAGALTAVWGGTPKQIEIAAEIGMEHNLGLTCDPVDGLVQIPCIERNTMGAIKAINAARLALRRTGSNHKVSLDDVIKTMFQTGKDMQSIYKETSLGGLAVNVIYC
ncbi:MAG: L-serine dehydratase 2 [Chlamydiae bacterium]|nr:L-serine dehydratase 2 [Chlamydiota bacterium]